MSSMVKMLASTDTNAPVLNGTAGSLIAVLKAALVTGYSPLNPVSLTVSNNVATLTFSAAHPYRVKQVINVSGANEAAFNGDWKLTAVTNLTASFAIPGNVPATATGTLLSKVAPLGWELQYNDDAAYKAVFRSLQGDSTKYALVVEDDSGNKPGVAVANLASGPALGARAATLRMCENAYSTTSWDRSSSLVLRKAQNATTTSRPWYIFGDGKRFYMAVNWSEVYPGMFDFSFFGDIISYKAGDAHHCLLVAARGCSVQDNADPAYSDLLHSSSGYYGRRFAGSTVYSREFDTFLDANMDASLPVQSGVMPPSFGMTLGRAYHQNGSFQNALNCVGVGGCGGLYRTGGGLDPGLAGDLFFTMGGVGCYSTTFPNGPDNGLLVQAPMYVREFYGSSPFRGHFPGLVMPLQNSVPPQQLYSDVRFGANDFRDVFIVCGTKLNSNTGSVRSRLGFDVTGPWE